jgi:hypothetical protein
MKTPKNQTRRASLILTGLLPLTGLTLLVTTGCEQNKVRDVLDARPGEAVRDAAEDAAERAEELKEKAEEAVEDAGR